mmetsp:Transcript_10912/g.11987  ORF Transcript_10912/g.11987 Transcript_10912/m.11987 type:complete len:122 (-) Transcript_10912:71-436(-)
MEHLQEKVFIFYANKNRKNKKTNNKNDKPLHFHTLSVPLKNRFKHVTKRRKYQLQHAIPLYRKNANINEYKFPADFLDEDGRSTSTTLMNIKESKMVPWGTTTVNLNYHTIAHMSIQFVLN